MITFGLRWDFLPFAPWPDASSFSFLSLRLETFLKYGGPVAQFLDEQKQKTKLRFYSDYLPAGGSWDSVHQLSLKEFALTHKPFEIECRNVLLDLPRPADVVRELLASLPQGAEASLLVRSQADINRIRDLNGVYLAVAASDWFETPGELSHVAERIRELEIDERAFERLDLCEKLIGEIVQASGDAELAVNFLLLPSHTQDTVERALAFKMSIERELK